MGIRIGIAGYGNLGRGVEHAIRQNKDMELRAILTRRQKEELKTLSAKTEVYHMEEAKRLIDEIDVMILCGGSAKDLPLQSPQMAKRFNIVDSFDNHSKICEHFEAVDRAAKEGGKIGVISAGWDPGLFSLNRLLGNAILPEGADYTFWGRGVSQGHSDAIRRVEGVLDARQYTVPIKEALGRVRAGEWPKLSPRQKHIRECYVLAAEGADRERIEEEIKTMPAYFADYDTIVHFIEEEELKTAHAGMPHGGLVIRSGKTGENQGNIQLMEYRLVLDSNPEFTASVLLAYARAAYRLQKEGESGARTVFDIAPAYLIDKSARELRKEML